MKVFAIFAFIQIVGILGNPVAPEDDQARNNEIDKVQALQSIFSDLRFSRLDEYPVEWTERGRMKCRMNGGINVENSGFKAIGTYSDSYMELTNVTLLHLERASHAPHGSLAPAVKTVCTWFTKMNTFSKNLMHSLEPCWSTKESTSANLIHNISSALVQYACENEGSRLSTFLNTDGDVCLSSSGREIGYCFDTSFSYDTKIVETADSSQMNPPWDFPIISLNTQACREFGTFQQCVVRVLGRCPNPTPSYQINSLFNIVTNTSGCKNLLEKQ